MKFGMQTFIIVLVVCFAIVACGIAFQTPAEAQMQGAVLGNTFTSVDDTIADMADEGTLICGVDLLGRRHHLLDDDIYWKQIVLIIDPTATEDDEWELIIYRDGVELTTIPLWRGGVWSFPILCDSVKVTAGDAGTHYFGGYF